MAKRKKEWMVIVIVIMSVLAVGWSIEKVWTKPKTNADFHIANIYSTVDKDGDGIDDQSDILSSAKSYIETKPKYKSKYYASGYSDDEYGVCTDVVAQGLLHSGYDLRELVDQDIKTNPDDYDIDKPDKNIDFRRVRNLKIYFDHHAIRLTNDLNDISAWQGGDIVVFEDHIGVVSNLRNARGIPYLIHHASPLQIKYEEDVLTKYEVKGHYRMSE